MFAFARVFFKSWIKINQKKTSPFFNLIVESKTTQLMLFWTSLLYLLIFLMINKVFNLKEPNNYFFWAFKAKLTFF